jgi:hypothetical protein
MSGSKFFAAQDGHIVNALPPIDITGGKDSDVWTMKNYAHCTIIVQIGVSAAAFTKIILQACDDFTPSNTTDIAFRQYAEETALGDTLSVVAAVAATGTTPNAADNIMYVIEIDAAELPAGKPCLRLHLTNGANSVIASAVAILSGSRFAKDANATAIA